MKQLIASFVLTFATTVAFAYPGGNHLSCKSASNSGSKQVIELSLDRSNGAGWYAPVISMTVNGKKMILDTPDEMNQYGETYHDSALGVILVTADNSTEKNTNTEGNFSVMAIPSSVKAVDSDGTPMKWSIQAEKDECNDSNGKAKFQGVFHGFLNSGKKNIDLDTQVLDCELDYDSGMAC